MTTIAWDGKNLAADSQTTSGSTVTNMNCKKIINFGAHNHEHKIDGQQVIAFGYGGNAGSDEIIKSALKSNLKFYDEFPVDFEFCAIVITKRKACYLIQKDKGEKSICIVEQPDKYAIGSGRDFALAVLHCGHDASKAVAVAAQLDAYTGGVINNLNLEYLE